MTFELIEGGAEVEGKGKGGRSRWQPPNEIRFGAKRQQ